MMCQSATAWGKRFTTGGKFLLARRCRSGLAAAVVVFILGGSVPVWGQAPVNDAGPEWRRIGNSAIEAALPSVATGTIHRVWYSADGTILYAASLSTLANEPAVRIWETRDFETWTESVAGAVPPAATEPLDGLPESGARVKRALGRAGRWYALGRFAYR
ncbi:MAG: hypothetical protein JNL98_07820, partial [Bryobacterales bacterium]|nr:hypothetical protein [Bryobacterales bacterium]